LSRTSGIVGKCKGSPLLRFSLTIRSMEHSRAFGFRVLRSWSFCLWFGEILCGVLIGVRDLLSGDHLGVGDLDLCGDLIGGRVLCGDLISVRDLLSGDHLGVGDLDLCGGLIGGRVLCGDLIGGRVVCGGLIGVRDLLSGDRLGVGDLDIETSSR
jgi:hypothetical protein